MQQVNSYDTIGIIYVYLFLTSKRITSNMYVLAIGFRISMAATEEWPRVQAAHVHSFVAQVMEAAGTATEHAQNLAEVLTLADTRGHYSHGINRLGKYMFFSFLCDN